MPVYEYEEGKIIDEVQQLSLLQDRLQRITDYIDSCTSKINLHNYTMPNMLRETESRNLWDEAIFIASKGMKLFPEDKQWYEYEIKILEHKKSGDKASAINVNLERWVLDGDRSSAYHWAGDRFLEIGMHDRAWELYNRAIELAAIESYSPHTIRQSMTKLLIKEERYSTAIDIVIAGICEAEKLNKKGSPKSMLSLLKRVLKLDGIYKDGLEKYLYELCKSKGMKRAKSYLKKQRNN